MTIQATIQSLYADIAAIKEFVCKVDGSIVSKGVFTNISNPQTIVLPVKTKYILIESYSELYLSRIFDRGDSDYDEYLYEGFGSMCQSIRVGNERAEYDWQKIDRTYSSFAVKDRVQSIRIRPCLSCTLIVRLFGFQ